MFFADGHPTQSALIARVLADAADYPGCETSIQRDGDWVMVCGNSDWMTPGAFAFLDLFSHFIPQRSGGLNADRAELFVVAVAKAMLTVGEAGDFAHGLTAADLPPRFAEAMRGVARTLVWRP